MLRISLLSGLHTPRSSCSKLEMRATPEPAKIKIDSGKNEDKNVCETPLLWLQLFSMDACRASLLEQKQEGVQDQDNALYLFLWTFPCCCCSLLQIYRDKAQEICDLGLQQGLDFKTSDVNYRSSMTYGFKHCS